MTDEELTTALGQVNDSLAKFGTEDKLPDKEWRQMQRLKREKSILDSIQKAKKDNNVRQEVKQIAQYQLLKDETKMNPFIKYILQLKLRSNLWM